MSRYLVIRLESLVASYIPKRYEKELNNSFWVYEEIITLQGPNYCG